MRPRWLLGLALLATAALYWSGLPGPFLLDDIQNLMPVQQWLQGTISWQQAMFGNGSGLLGRPISMASFLLNASLMGTGAFSFKLGNLIVHLACGLLVWFVVRRVLAKDDKLSAHAESMAGIVAALWLLHPLHASTVLYAVQRMAELGALFALASVWIYLIARDWLVVGQSRKAMMALFVFFPLVLTAGLLSKETAAVAPGLCLVMELAYFRDRPRQVQIFFGAFLLLPLLAAASVLALQPERVFAPFERWDYGMGEKLLTQSRVLMDYIGQLLWPRGPLMGLYHDDFAYSTGLLSPGTTLLSILALAGISAFALAVRRRAPSVFAGWFFFLAAHALESSFLPMDLYFEHRNYLPAVGLLLGMAGLCALVPRRLSTAGLSRQQLGYVFAGGLILMFAFVTLGRARVWRYEQLLVNEGLKYHPRSQRAIVDGAALAQKTGRYEDYASLMDRLIRSNDPRSRLLGHVYSMTLDCVRYQQADPQDLRQAVADAPSIVTLSELHALRTLARVSQEQGCGAVAPTDVADAIVLVLRAAKSQSDDVQSKWTLRYTATELYLGAGHWPEALAQAELAWQPSADAAVGALLAQLYLQAGRLDDADRTLTEAYRRLQPYAKADRAALNRIGIQIKRLRRQ